MKKDPASRRALEQSVGLAFRFLFLAVGVLAVAWLVSGFVGVEAGNRAVVLRFGQIERISDSGLVWAWPRPIEQVVLVPASERQLTHTVAVLDLAGRESQSVPAEVALDQRDGGYVLSGDGGLVHLTGVITYQVRDAATWLLVEQRLPVVLERAFTASTIAAIAGRDLDGVLATRSQAEAGSDGLAAAARREALRGDIRAGMNRRLATLAPGIEVSRIDLSAALPAKAKPAFDQVLAAEAEAARVVASARTDAEKYRQQGERDRTAILDGARAKGSEAIAKARVATDRITALMAESSPARRTLLLTRLYRERMEDILRRAGVVTVVDGSQPLRLVIPGGTERK
jgi:regulator of protease activity HflC (stomatin/prohibitin superfamily)